MTLVEAYHHTRRLERSAAASGGRLPAWRPALLDTVMVGAFGCLWAGAFAARYGWF